MKIKIINVSDFLSGKEFADAVSGSNENLFLITGEEKNSFLSKMSEPETEQKFKIGDTVRLSDDNIKFNGLNEEVAKNVRYSVVGVEKVDDQYLYSVIGKNGRFEFFGYELEKVKLDGNVAQVMLMPAMIFIKAN